MASMQTEAAFTGRCQPEQRETTAVAAAERATTEATMESTINTMTTMTMTTSLLCRAAAAAELPAHRMTKGESLSWTSKVWKYWLNLGEAEFGVGSWWSRWLRWGLVVVMVDAKDS